MSGALEHEKRELVLASSSGNLASRLLARVEDAGVAIAGVILMSVMIVITLDVVMRYLINSPLRWSYDLLSLLLVPSLFYLSLSQALRLGDHISVDFFSHMMSRRWRYGLLAAGMALSCLTLTFVAYVLLHDAYASFSKGEEVLGYYVWPIWIPKAIAFLGTTLIAIRSALLTFTLARSAASDAD